MKNKTIQTRQPTHPGAILREDVLPVLSMTVSAFARNMGVSRQMLHGILAERTGVTPGKPLTQSDKADTLPG
jgi:addiction module HigA family antidote